MSSPFSTERSELCQHVSYRIGCLSCCAHDRRDELKEAIVENEKCEESVKAYQACLEQSNLSDTERKHFWGKLERAKNLRAAWDNRCQVLNQMVTYVETPVKNMCASNDSKALSEAFENSAIEREEVLKQIWRNAARSDSEETPMSFCSKDPNCKLPFKGLDRSNIPATSDTLVRGGVGLQLFLRAAKNLQRLPKDAVGENTGPAIMSYGRALKMFGVPDEPGKDWRQKSEPSVEPSFEDSLAQIDIAHIPEPKTEREHRQLAAGHPPIVPLFSEEQQWALFGKTKHMADVAVLARQYARLVAEKEDKEDKERKQGKKGKRSGESSTKESVVPDSSTDPATTNAATDAATDAKGWPLVEQLDWVGFANWVYRCKLADKGFEKTTLPKWRAQREERKATLVAKIKEWKAPEGFNERLSSKHPDPKQFYTGKPLAELDMEKLNMEDREH